jgi:hypothetical protein
MKWLAAVLMVTLTGCATLRDGLLGNYHLYDPLEYHMTVDLVIQARDIEKHCGNVADVKAHLVDMTNNVNYFMAYLEGRPHNARTMAMNQELKTMVLDTARRDSMSQFFCRERSKNIVQAAEILRSHSGGKKE